MEQFIYAYEDIAAIGVIIAESAEAAEMALKKRYEESNSFMLEEIDPNGYEEDGIQPKMF